MVKKSVFEGHFSNECDVCRKKQIKYLSTCPFSVCMSQGCNPPLGQKEHTLQRSNVQPPPKICQIKLLFIWVYNNPCIRMQHKLLSSLLIFFSRFHFHLAFSAIATHSHNLMEVTPLMHMCKSIFSVQCILFPYLCARCETEVSIINKFQGLVLYLV